MNAQNCLIEKAYKQICNNLTSDKIRRKLLNELESKKIVLKYYRSFKGYNANVRYSNCFVEFHLSFLWKNISEDIQIGLIQSLLVKMYNINVKTLNQELYEIFLKKVHRVIDKSKQDPILLKSFERVNEEYFNGIIEAPNLVWGKKSFSKFGSYDFTTDTIIISSIFKTLIKKRTDLLDYVMYHEMLHKKLKFFSTAKRRSYHTKEFKKLEAKFKNSELLEKELKKIATKKRFYFFFL